MQKVGASANIERVLSIATTIGHGSAVLRAAVLGGAAFLLVTMGGAIVAAPVVLPLLAWSAARTPSRRVRGTAAVLAALTAAEAGWAAAYLTVGEQQPWIVAVPVVAGALVATVCLKLARR